MFQNQRSPIKTRTLLFLLLLTKSQREKNIEKTFFVSAGAQKRWGTAGSGNILPQYMPHPRKKFSVKLIFTTDKKAKTISLKVFKRMDFKNWQQETTKGTLRP